MEYTVAIKNEEDLYELICSGFENILLSEKNKMQKNMNILEYDTSHLIKKEI